MGGTAVETIGSELNRTSVSSSFIYSEYTEIEKNTKTDNCRVILEQVECERETGDGGDAEVTPGLSVR